MRKLLITTILALVITIAIGAMAEAAVTCTFQQTATTIGTASTYINGTSRNLSVSIVNTNAKTNVTKGRISVDCGTITGALTFGGNTSTSQGKNRTYLNTTVNTKRLSDDTACIFTMTVFNNTGITQATCTRTYYTNNTVPQCSIVYPAANSLITTGKKYVGNAANSSSCSFIAGRTYTGSMNGTSGSEDCYYSFGKGFPPEEKYTTITMSAYDGLDEKRCTVSNVLIDDTNTLGRKNQYVADQETEIQKSSNNSRILLVILAIVIFLNWDRVKKKL